MKIKKLLIVIILVMISASQRGGSRSRSSSFRSGRMSSLKSWSTSKSGQTKITGNPWVGFIVFFGVFGVVGYFSYKQKKLK